MHNDKDVIKLKYKVMEGKEKMDFFSNGFNSFIILMKTFRVADFLDIVIMSLIIYYIIKLVRETRASQLVKGIIILIIAYFLSYQLDFKMVSSVLNKFFEFGIIALLVVFQPELRRALEQIGRSNISKYWSSSIPDKKCLSIEQVQKRCIDAVVDTVGIFQRSKTGALIVFERQTKLGDIIDTGTVINADASVPLIGNMFFNKAPLHDGAMIVRRGRVCAAGCILPLTKNDTISADIGTRHRSALGISEISDSIAIVVSEETGTISVAENGILTRNFSKEQLRRKLYVDILSNMEENDIRKNLICKIKRILKNEKKKV